MIGVREFLLSLLLHLIFMNIQLLYLIIYVNSQQFCLFVIQPINKQENKWVQSNTTMVLLKTEKKDEIYTANEKLYTVQ